MGLLSITDAGVVDVIWTDFFSLTIDIFTLASPDTVQWQVFARGGANVPAMTVRNDTGPYPAAVRKIYRSAAAGSTYELTVTNAGVLQLTQFVSSLVFSPIGNSQFRLDTNVPAAGYKLFTYLYNSPTLATVYQNYDFSQLHTNPIILNSLGLPPAPIFIEMGKSYRFIFAPPTSTDFPTGILFEWNGVKGGAEINRSSPTEFITEVIPAVSVSDSSFTLNGDTRRICTTGRRVRGETAGVLLAYGTIISATYDGTNTTVILIMDAGLLTTSLDSIRLSILSAQESAMPARRLIGLNTAFRGGLKISAPARFNLLPPGLMMYYPIAAGPPPHWLWCDGTYYNASDYPNLYGAIGTIYGSLGLGNFRVPYANGVFFLGLENMGGSAPRGLVTIASHNGNLSVVQGGIGGIEVWQLSNNEFPYHNHGYSLNTTPLQNSDEAGATGTTSVKRADFGASASAGSDGAHSNMPPYLACNIIIHT